MVVLLHGRGSRAQLPGGPFENLSHAIRVIVPQASEPIGDGWQWLPVRVGSGLLDRLAASLVATGGQRARFLRVVQGTRSTVGKPIVTGFSQGGIVSYGLAFYHDDVVGTVIPIAAWLPPALEPAYRRTDNTYPPVRALHGREDGTVPIGPTRELFERLKERGFDAELVEFEGARHETTPAMNALFHAWLESAICQALDDAVCVWDAENEARALQGLPPQDAGVYRVASEVPGDASTAADAGPTDARVPSVVPVGDAAPAP
jgi:phospholipase/carboxylesterase